MALILPEPPPTDPSADRPLLPERQHPPDMPAGDASSIGPDSPLAAEPGRVNPRPDSESVETGDTDPALLELIDEFSARSLAGELLAIDEFAAAHPEWAGPLRKLLPTMQRLTKLNRAVGVNRPEPVMGSRDELDRKVFGDFRIVREIARGGMGVVYEAEQVTLARTVALKVLPLAATLDPRALRRFQLEAQVAGLLQHPRIVPVHAVGMVDDVPYYAMQYIEGGSLADLIRALKQLDAGSAVRADRSEKFREGESRRAGTALAHGSPGPPSGDGSDRPADSLSDLAAGLLSGRWTAPRASVPEAAAPAGPSSLSEAPHSIRNRAYIRAIARLGIEAAGAVAYAHDQGVVHRDIKPANILLNRDGDLWVADFGMADVQGRDGLTMTGDLPGTLRYMSPEQALGKRSQVDRRTDIYALGATLYELLALRPVVPGTDKQEMLHRIADDEPQPLRKLNPAVPVDLATIVAKCLAKDPASRYQTAWQLSDELTRFLDGRPIAARPVGAIARTGRWCQRRPAQAALATGLMLSLAGGVAGITWNWREAVRLQHEAEKQKELLQIAQQETTQERDQKEVERAKADAINRFLIDKLLLQASPAKNANARGVTLRAALDRAAEEVSTSFQGQPRIEAAIHLALGQTYHELGELASSESHFRRTLALLGVDNANLDPDRIQATIELGHILFHAGRNAEAERLLNQALVQSRRRWGAAHDASIMATRYLASLYRVTGRAREGETVLRQSIEETRRQGRDHSPEAIRALNDLSQLLGDARAAESVELLRIVVKYEVEIFGPLHPDSLTAQHNLALALAKMGRLEEAETLFRSVLEARKRVIGPDHLYTLRNVRALADVLRKRGGYKEAEELLRSCHESQRKNLGPDHADTLQTAKDLSALIANRAEQK